MADGADKEQTDHNLLMQIAVDQKAIMVLVKERFKQHEKSIDEHHRVLFGNGRGLKTRVEIMWYSFGAVGLIGSGWLLYSLTRGW